MVRILLQKSTENKAEKMAQIIEKVDVCVIGAGHAGCEAALACARMGLETVIFTVSVESIALMPCNPNIGGSSKGHLVRELDALGGEMGKNIDHTFIQSKMLNASKGPAVHSLRAQADKAEYSRRMRQILENQEHLVIKQAEVCDLLWDDVNADTVSGKAGATKKIRGVRTFTGTVYEAKAVILCTGTYLKARCLCGESITYTGPNGLQAANHLTDSLKEMGGRLDGRLTVDFAQQGELAASDMVKRFGTGKVAIIQGIPGAAQSEGRTAGAKKVFESTKGVELVSVQPANWDSTAAYNAASDIIQAHGDLKGIFCCNDVMALAASRALTDAGLKDKVLLYGVDGTEEAKTAIKEGRMDGTITYPSSAYAKAAVIMLLKLAQGMDMSQTVYCPLDVINTENVAQFDGYM